MDKLLQDFKNITLEDTKYSSTQTKSKNHHTLVKEILIANNFKKINNDNFIKKLKNIIRENKIFCENFAKISNGKYFYEEILGRQSPPDFILLNIIDNNVKIIYLECKSGKNKIMWNDSYLKENYIYLYTDVSKKTYLFSGNKENIILFVGEEAHDKIKEMYECIKKLRIIGSDIKNIQNNIMKFNSFPRINLSSNGTCNDNITEKCDIIVTKVFLEFFN